MGSPPKRWEDYWSKGQKKCGCQWLSHDDCTKHDFCADKCRDINHKPCRAPSTTTSPPKRWEDYWSKGQKKCGCQWLSHDDCTKHDFCSDKCRDQGRQEGDLWQVGHGE